MKADDILKMCDVLILILGLYSVWFSYRMNEETIVHSWFLAEEELKIKKNLNEFCRKICLPTRIFGFLSCILALLDGLNRFVWHIPYVGIFLLSLFVIVYLWYMKKLKDAKDII